MYNNVYMISNVFHFSKKYRKISLCKKFAFLVKIFDAFWENVSFQRIRLFHKIDYKIYHLLPINIFESGKEFNTIFSNILQMQHIHKCQKHVHILYDCDVLGNTHFVSWVFQFYTFDAFNFTMEFLYTYWKNLPHKWIYAQYTYCIGFYQYPLKSKFKFLIKLFEKIENWIVNRWVTFCSDFDEKIYPDKNNIAITAVSFHIKLFEVIHLTFKRGHHRFHIRWMSQRWTLIRR